MAGEVKNIFVTARRVIARRGSLLQGRRLLRSARNDVMICGATISPLVGLFLLLPCVIIWQLMKILTVLTYYRPHTSGLTIYAERLAKAFVARGHEVTVMTTQFETDPNADYFLYSLQKVT